VPFDLLNMTKAKLMDIVVLSQKNRQPDENPGAKLQLSMALPNHALSQFDGFLKGMLFTKTAPKGARDKQETLEGVEAVSDMPNLSGIGAKIGCVHWAEELTGYTLVIDQGLGGKRSNIEIGDCTLSGWKFTPKEGGSVIVTVNCESADVSESAFGKLAKLKSREIELTLTAPEPADDAQQDIEQPARGRGKKREPAGAEA
jgi:hypothetical protein